MKNTTKKLTLSAILSALSVVILFLGSITDVLDLSAAALAGFVVVIAVIEINGIYPLMIYLVTAVISALILPNKLPVFVFAVFAGFYPILKSLFERYNPIISWLLKFSLFNVCLLIMIFMSKFFINQEIFLFSFKIIVFFVANIVFLLYDICMSKIILIYLVKIRSMLRLRNYFK